MRLPNDQKLAQESVGIDLILGGHDHFYAYEVVNSVPIVKSGTDFRWLSRVSITLPSADKNTKTQKAQIKLETIDITTKVRLPLFRRSLHLF